MTFDSVVRDGSCYGLHKLGQTAVWFNVLNRCHLVELLVCQYRVVLCCNAFSDLDFYLFYAISYLVGFSAKTFLL